MLDIYFSMYMWYDVPTKANRYLLHDGMWYNSLQEVPVMSEKDIMQIVQTEKKFQHSRMVSEISHILATNTGFSESDIQIVTEAARLHDIGKNDVPESILKKPAKLTDQEFMAIQTHTQAGFTQLIHQVKILLAAAIMALQHHEKPSGNGYAGITHIHTYAKLVAVADVFDALISKRPYKQGWPPDEIISYMRTNEHKEFDSDYVKVLLQSMDEILTLYDMESTNHNLMG